MSTGFLGVQKQLSILQPRSLEARGVLHAEPRVPEQQHHRARLGTKRAPVRQGVRGLQNPFDVGVLKWKRGPLSQLRWLQNHRWVRLHPSRVLAEAQKATQVFQALHSRQCGVAPAVSERAQGGNVQLFQKIKALGFAEGKQLAFQQFAALPDSGWRKVPRGRVFEVLLDSLCDRRYFYSNDAYFARCFPAVDRLGCLAPVASVERVLDPSAAEGTLHPDSAVAVGVSATLRPVGTLASVASVERKAAGWHLATVARCRGKVCPSCVPAPHISVESIASIRSKLLNDSGYQVKGRSESHPLRQSLAPLGLSALVSGITRCALRIAIRHESHPLRQPSILCFQFLLVPDTQPLPSLPVPSIPNACRNVASAESLLQHQHEPARIHGRPGSGCAAA